MKTLEKIKVKDGSIIDFIAISYYEPHWEFDRPSILLAPIIQYSDCDDSLESFIENICIDLLSNEHELISDNDLGTSSKSLKTLKRMANNLMKGKEDGKRIGAVIRKEKVRFFINIDEELDFETVELKEFNNYL